MRLQQEVGDAPRELGVQALAEEEGEECEEVGEDGEGQDEEGVVERWGGNALEGLEQVLFGGDVPQCEEDKGLR